MNQARRAATAVAAALALVLVAVTPARAVDPVDTTSTDGVRVISISTYPSGLTGAPVGIADNGWVALQRAVWEGVGYPVYIEPIGPAANDEYDAIAGDGTVIGRRPQQTGFGQQDRPIIRATDGTITSLPTPSGTQGAVEPIGITDDHLIAVRFFAFGDVCGPTIARYCSALIRPDGAGGWTSTGLPALPGVSTSSSNFTVTAIGGTATEPILASGGWTWQPAGGYTALPVATYLGGVPYAIAESGAMAGLVTVASGTGVAAYWPSPTDDPIEIGALPGHTNSIAVGMNELGGVVGYSYDAAAPSVTRAWYWQADEQVIRPLGEIPGDTVSRATDIDDAGRAVGMSGTTPVIWDIPGGLDIDRPPELVSIDGPEPVDPGGTFEIAYEIRDVDGDPFTVTWEGLPDGAATTITDTSFTWQTTVDDLGLYRTEMVVTQNDEPRNVLRVPVLFDVVGDPVIDPIGPQTAPVGEWFSITLTATGAATPAWLPASPLPSGATLDIATGEFRWRPTEDQIGSYDIDVELVDATTGRSGFATFTVTVPGETTPVSISITESVGVVDGVSVVPEVSLDPVVVSVTESIGVVDAPVLQRSVMISVTESVGVVDAPVVEAKVPPDPVVVSVTESIGVVDAPATQRSVTISITESIGVVDIPGATPQVPVVVSVTESIGVVDEPGVSLQTSVVVSVTESIGVVDDPSASATAPAVDVAANLSVLRGANDEGLILLGDEVELAATAINQGPGPATGVTGTIVVPDGWTIVTVPDQCALDPTPPNGLHSIDCSFTNLPDPDLSPRPTSRRVITVVPDESGAVEFDVRSDATDPDPDDNHATIDLDVRESMHMSVVRTFSDRNPRTLLWNPEAGRVEATSEIAFRGQVSNSSLLDVAIRLSIASGADLEVAWFPDECAVTDDAGTLVLECEDVEPYTALLFGVRVTATAAGSYAVTTTIDNDEYIDPNPADNIVTTVVEVVEAPPVRLRAIEVTQALQDWDNSVPLYQGKDTVARVFLEDPLGERRGGVMAGRNAAGQSLAPGPLRPVDGPARTNGAAEDRRDDLDGSVNFRLPGEWVDRDSIELVYSMSAPGRRIECPDGAVGFTCAVEVDFEPSDPIDLDTFAIGYVTDEVYQLEFECSRQPTDRCGTGTIVMAHGSATVDLEVADLFSIGSCLDDATRSPSDNPCSHLRRRLSTVAAVDEADTVVRGKVVAYDADGDVVDRRRDASELRGEFRVSVRQGENLAALAVTSNPSGVSATVAANRDGGRTVAPPTTGEVVEQVRRVRTAFPTGDIDMSFGFMPSFGWMPHTYRDINPRLAASYALKYGTNPIDDRPGAASLTPRMGGFLHGGSVEGWAGWANRQVFSAYLGSATQPLANGGARQIAAHELAHTFGTPHAVVSDVETDDGTRTVGLCGARGPEGAPFHPFVYDTGVVNPGLELDVGSSTVWPIIGDLGDVVAEDRVTWGFDPRLVASGDSAMTIVDPERSAELMSYCWAPTHLTFPSVATYDQLADGIAQNRLSFGGDGGGMTAGPDGDFMVVAGSIEDDLVDIAVVTGASGTTPQYPTGDVEVVFVDANGSVLSSAAVALGDSHGLPVDGADLETSFEGFVAAMPRPGTAVSALQVRRNGDVIGSFPASAQAPVVAFDRAQVANATLTAQWTATDADGDPLTTSVLYSPDGGASWDVLAVALGEQRLSVPIARLRPSPAAVLKVVVSDGMRLAEATSAPFAVADVGPTVEIVEPLSPVSEVSAESMLRLDAIAIDGTRGILPASAVSWTSSLSGVLGVGSPLDVDASTLGAGCHIITASATEGSGALGRDTVAVGVGAPCPADAVAGQVVVEVIGDRNVSLDFSSDVPGAASFSIRRGISRTVSAAPADYELRSSVPDGWSLDAIDCRDPSGGSIATVDLAMVTLDLDVGETIRCSFVVSADPPTRPPTDPPDPPGNPPVDPPGPPPSVPPRPRVLPMTK